MTEKFFKVSKPCFGGNSYLTPFEDGIKLISNEIETMITDGKVWEDLLITIVEHNKEDVDNAPEFMGR